MDDRDRAIVAAAEERDRKSLIRCRFTYVAVDGRPWECGYTQTADYAHHGHEFALPEGAAADRRELLRIVREQEAAMKGVVAVDYVEEPLAGDPDAEAEAEFLRPIGPGR